MPLGAPPLLSPEPEPLSPFFDPTCAACGRGNLDTVGSKTHGAGAGFCPSCGVFVCFNCTNSKGWQGWNKKCPACGRHLRSNTALFFVAMFGLAFMLVATLPISTGLHQIQIGSDERAQMDMAVQDPGAARIGSTVKISGTVAGTRQTPIFTAYISNDTYSGMVWSAYDFDVNTTNGTVRVRASLLTDTSVSARQIIGQDGLRGAYNIGDGIVVIGRTAGNRTRPEIAPERIAPTSSALYGGSDAEGWRTVLLSSLAFPVAFFSLWALLARYRSHRKRVWDFKTEASTMPRSSVEGPGAGATALRLPAFRPETPPEDRGRQEVELVILSAEGLVEGKQGQSVDAEEVVNLLRLAKSFLRSENYAKAMRYAKIAEEKARALR